MNKDQENIKYLVQKPKTPVIKPPTYRSIYSKSIKREYNLNRGCHQTMGFAEVKLNRPSEFLKKQTRKVMRPFVDNTYKKKIQNPVQCQSYPDKPIPQKKITKNYLRENIVDVIRKVAPLPKHRVQDSRYGHTMVLDEAGLEPTFTSKKNFGKIPLYIEKIVKENEIIRQAEIERIRAIKPPLRCLHDKERDVLLIGLKANWDNMYKKFLLLPMVTDTVPKIIRKARLEKQLNQLEKDINMLERYPTLYVCNN